MLAFSLGKLLFLGFILVVLWYGVKFLTHFGELRQAVRRAAMQAAAHAARMEGQQGRPARPPAVPTENLIKCGACGAFVPARSATRCARGDCPWAG